VGRSLSRLVFAGLALTFATLAIPIRLEGKWITLAFAIEGAVLVWTGFRALHLRLRQAGYFLLALAAVRLLLFPISASEFFFNARFATYLVLIACMVAARLAAREQAAILGDQEATVLAILAVTPNAYAILALSLEFWDYFGRNALPGLGRSSRASTLLSRLLWTLYASVLILGRRKASIRSTSLASYRPFRPRRPRKSFCTTFPTLDRFYRIVSLLILGVPSAGRFPFSTRKTILPRTVHTNESRTQFPFSAYPVSNGNFPSMRNTSQRC